MIGRRDLLGAGLGALVSDTVRAQAPGRVYRVGSLHIAPRDAPHHLSFRAEMARLGFVDGRNIDFDRRGHGLRPEAFPEHAARLVEAKVDAIYVGGDTGVAAAATATRTIPILGVTDDIVGTGFALSLSRPGRNVTGFSVLAALLDGKRQELLLELLPDCRRLAALGDRTLTNDETLTALGQAARLRGVALETKLVSTPEEIGPAVEALRAAGAQALNVLATPLLFNHERIIIETAHRLGLATMHQWPDSARAGGLAGYGPNMPEVYRTHVARVMVRLLNGADPADVPIEQPTRLELVVNRRVAAMLNIDLPASILARADEVIE